MGNKPTKPNYTNHVFCGGDCEIITLKSIFLIFKVTCMGRVYYQSDVKVQTKHIILLFRIFVSEALNI